MSVPRHLPTLSAACAMLVGVLAGPSVAEANYLAAGRAPADDAADPSPGRDITGVALSYDRETGTVRGGVTLRGPSTDASRAFLSLFAGARTSSGCDGYPAVGVSSFTADPQARWMRFDAAGPPSAAGDAEKGRSGELLTFEATAAALAVPVVDCVTATLTDPADPGIVYDRAGPFALRPLPELAVRLGRMPSVLEPGQTRAVRLTLRNPGDAATGPIRLAVGRRRGLTASVPRTAKALKAGQRRTLRIRVTLSSRAENATPLRVTVAAGKLRVRDEATLYLRRPSKGGGDGGSGVCASYAPVLGGVGDIVTYPC